MTLYEKRVKRLHDHVMANEKKAAKKANADTLTVEKLKALLDEKGVEYDSKAKKAELMELLDSSDENPTIPEGAE